MGREHRLLLITSPRTPFNYLVLRNPSASAQGILLFDCTVQEAHPSGYIIRVLRRQILRR